MAQPPRTRSCAHTPSSTSACSGASLRASYRKPPPAGIIWDAAGCGSLHDVRRGVVGWASTLWTRTRAWTARVRTRAAGRERGHMAHGAVWLRVRLSISLWRWRRTACRGLADWWNGIVRLSRLEDWDTYISSVSGLAHAHAHSTQAQSHHSSSAHSAHLPASTVAGGSGQGSVH